MKPTGDIDRACDGKNAWDNAVRTFVSRILDISIVECEHHKAEFLKKLREALDSEFEYVGGELSRQGFRNAIKRFLKGKRSRLKTKYLAGHTECPLHVQPAQWDMLKEYWATDGQVQKAAKMANSRKQVKNVSSTGRKGKAGVDAQLVSNEVMDCCIEGQGSAFFFPPHSYELH
jgi:hypothetical protein